MTEIASHLAYLSQNERVIEVSLANSGQPEGGSTRRRRRRSKRRLTTPEDATNLPEAEPIQGDPTKHPIGPPIVKYEGKFL
jgi:hypothetical protein